MNEDAPEKIVVRCEVDGVVTEGYALRRPLGQSERVLRSAKMFGIFFLIAFFTIFIPILHFILPPIMLVLGLVFATTTYLETAMVLEGQIACPNCRHVTVFAPEAEEWPKVQRCGGCSYMLTVVAEPSRPAGVITP